MSSLFQYSGCTDAHLRGIAQEQLRGLLLLEVRHEGALPFRRMEEDRRRMEEHSASVRAGANVVELELLRLVRALHRAGLHSVEFD